MKLRILLIFLLPITLTGCGESGRVSTGVMTDRWSSEPRVELIVEKKIVDKKSAEYWQSIANNYQKPDVGYPDKFRHFLLNCRQDLQIEKVAL